MPKLSNRQKILKEGLRLVHERGFAGAAVRDIVKGAGVSQGSFTDHFDSKEAFGLEVLDIYFEVQLGALREKLNQRSHAPLNDTPLFKTVRFQKHDYSVNEVPQSLRAPRSQRRANRRGTME
jgi:AcrR family transcriptional regulator